MQREEKCQRLQTELRHFLESLAVLVSGPNRFVESHENAIKDRIKEILAENKDQALVLLPHFPILYFPFSLFFFFFFFLFEKEREKIFPPSSPLTIITPLSFSLLPRLFKIFATR